MKRLDARGRAVLPQPATSRSSRPLYVRWLSFRLHLLLARCCSLLCSLAAGAAAPFGPFSSPTSCRRAPPHACSRELLDRASARPKPGAPASLSLGASFYFSWGKASSTPPLPPRMRPSRPATCALSRTFTRGCPNNEPGAPLASLFLGLGTVRTSVRGVRQLCLYFVCPPSPNITRTAFSPPCAGAPRFRLTCCGAPPAHGPEDNAPILTHSVSSVLFVLSLD